MLATGTKNPWRTQMLAMLYTEAKFNFAKSKLIPDEPTDQQGRTVTQATGQ